MPKAQQPHSTFWIQIDPRHHMLDRIDDLWVTIRDDDMKPFDDRTKKAGNNFFQQPNEGESCFVGKKAGHPVLILVLTIGSNKKRKGIVVFVGVARGI